MPKQTTTIPASDVSEIERSEMGRGGDKEERKAQPRTGRQAAPERDYAEVALQIRVSNEASATPSERWRVEVVEISPPAVAGHEPLKPQAMERAADRQAAVLLALQKASRGVAKLLRDGDIDARAR